MDQTHNTSNKKPKNSDKRNNIFKQKPNNRDKDISAQQENEDNGKKKTNVVNLSNHQLNDGTLRVLEKGLNFSVALSRIPVENVICSIENSILTLPRDTTEEIR